MVAGKIGTATRFRGRFAALTLLLCLAAASSGRDATADTYTVTNTNDSGVGSLRQAMLNANARVGADTIVFAAGVTGTIMPTKDLPILFDDVEIDGPGANFLTLTPDTRQLPIRLLQVDSALGAGPNVVIRGLAFDRGVASGGGSGLKNVHGTVTLRDCVFSNNGTDNLGGAISNASVMVLSGCTLKGNSVGGTGAPFQALTGGGIYNSGQMTLTNCTLSDNTIMINEGSAGNGSARGAGIYNAGSLNLSHCTFAKNNAYLYYIVSLFQQGRDAGQGGAVYNAGFLTIDNTILSADPDPTYGGTLANSGGIVLSHGYNLSSDGANGLLTASGDKASAALILMSLQDNGGSTPTCMPVPGSPAIDAGDPTFTTPPPTDQRGLARVIGPRIDIGAVEYRPPLDVDGDGHNDLLFQNSQTGQIVAWYMNGLNVQGGIGLNNTPEPGWKVVGSGDFNGDGFADLVFQNTTTKQVVVWYMRGTTRLGGEIIGWPISAYNLVAVADFNGDGRPDLVFEERTYDSNGSGYMTIHVWFYNRTTMIQETAISSSTFIDPHLHIVGVADFNRDGNPDLMFQNDLNGHLSVWYLDADRLLLSAPTLERNPDSGWKVRTVADYNNDGWPDLVFQNNTTGKVVIWFMNNTSFIGGDLTSRQPITPYQITGSF